MKKAFPANVDTELYIPNIIKGTKKKPIIAPGRADLVYYNTITSTAEVYEIKPWMSEDGYESAVKQLNGYITAMDTSNAWRAYSKTPLSAKVEDVEAGTTLKPFLETIKIESTKFPGYDIIYRMYSPGIITYDYVRQKPDENPQEAPCSEKSKEKVGVNDEAVAAIGVVVLVFAAATVATIFTGGGASWTYAFCF